MEEQNELLNKLEDAYIFYRESKHKFEQIKRDYESNLNKFNYNVKSIDSTLYQLKGGYINIDEVEKILTNLISLNQENILLSQIIEEQKERYIRIEKLYNDNFEVLNNLLSEFDHHKDETGWDD